MIKKKEKISINTIGLYFREKVFFFLKKIKEIWNTHFYES